jgi:hypothetical protein
VEIITQHVQHKYLSDPETLDWKVIPEFPQPGELMTIDPPPLPSGPTDENPFDKNAYLEFQYTLNRFEGTELLRRAVNRFKYDPTMKEDENDFYIYTQVSSLPFTPRVGHLHLEGTCSRIPVYKVWACMSHLLFYRALHHQSSLEAVNASHCRHTCGPIP